MEPINDKKHDFARLLKGLMHAGAGTGDRKKWTTEALAAALKVDPKTVANWRQGKNVPAKPNYKALLNVFGLNRDNEHHRDVITDLDEALDKARTALAEKDAAARGRSTHFLHFATPFPTTPTSPIIRASIQTWLDKNVMKERVGLLALTGNGGAGKTTSIRNWIAVRSDEQLQQHFDGVFLWSSYRQGQTIEFVSIDAFFDALGAFLNTTFAPRANMRSKANACLDLLLKNKVLLVIDGLEAFQYPPGEDYSKVGRFKDGDLQDFFEALAESKTSCTIVSSRISLAFNERETSDRVPQLMVDELTDPEALALVRSYGVDGSDSELMQYVSGCRWHPLTLALVAIFIKRAFTHGLPTLAEVRLNAPARMPEAKLAERVLEGYLAWLPKPEASLLLLCGLFDQPTATEHLYRLASKLDRQEQFDFSSLHNFRLFRFHLETLKLTGLVSDDDSFAGVLDIHPIIRDYLGSLLRQKLPQLWTLANQEMYQLLGQASGSIPLLRRIVFGCRGGLAEQAFNEVYEPHFSRFKGTLSEDGQVSNGALLYAINSFFEREDPLKLIDALSRNVKQTILLDAASAVIALRGYANQQLPLLFAYARELLEPRDSISWRIMYSECRFHRMAGNLLESKHIADRLKELGYRNRSNSLLIGAYRNESAYYFYAGDFAQSEQLALAGEKLRYRDDWRKDPLGFVNNPRVMLPGYAALSAALTNHRDNTLAAVRRMHTEAEKSDAHSVMIAAFIDTILADLGYGDFAEASERFERLSSKGEFAQWFAAANIMRAAARNADSKEFERLIRRWMDTGARLFVPYWYALAGETAARTGDINSVHSFSARGLAIARATGETWANARLDKLSLLKL